jgi:hypothetical protein
MTTKRKAKFDLKLEVREGAIADIQPLTRFGILVTPDINEDFWLLRVKVSDTQAVVGFPKFTLLGIGFQVEADDWNTNLPSQTPAEQIFQHIARNKGDESIPDKRCIEAIKMIQDAWKALKA